MISKQGPIPGHFFIFWKFALQVSYFATLFSLQNFLGYLFCPFISLQMTGNPLKD
jgi:hypothetical protein